MRNLNRLRAAWRQASVSKTLPTPADARGGQDNRAAGSRGRGGRPDKRRAGIARIGDRRDAGLCHGDYAEAAERNADHAVFHTGGLLRERAVHTAEHGDRFPIILRADRYGYRHVAPVPAGYADIQQKHKLPGRVLARSSSHAAHAPAG